MKKVSGWILFYIFVITAIPWVCNGIGEYWRWVDHQFENPTTESKDDK